MQKKLWILIIITGLVVGYTGGALGAVLARIPLKILPNSYSLIYSVVIIVIGLLLLFKSVLDLISKRIDISRVSGVFDSSLLVLYKLFFYIGVITIIMAVFITNVLFR